MTHLMLLVWLFIQPSFGAFGLEDLPEEDREKISNLFPTKKLKDLNGAQLDQVVKELMATGRYEHIAISKRNETIRLVARQVRTITEIEFIGNYKFSGPHLTDIGRIKTDRPFDKRIVYESARQIQSFYADNGFLKATVEIKIQNLSETESAVRYIVSEGPQTKIREIRFQSENQDLRDELDEIAETFIGRAYNQNEINEMQTKLREMLISENYFTTRLETAEVQNDSDRAEALLNYKVVDPYQYEILFIGNLNYADIRNDTDINSISSSPSNFVPEITNRVKSRYLDRGYARVKVRPESEQNDDRFVRRLNFVIEEGPRVRLEKIDFTGRFSQSKKRYADFIVNNSSDLISDGYYNKEDLETGHRNLIVDLQNQGFLQARVISSSIRYNDSQDGVIYKVNLDEGPLTRIQSIEFVGVKSLTREELLSLLALQPGSPLRLNQLEDGITKIQKKYLDLGHLEMNYLTEKKDIIKYSEGNTLANLQIEIYEGPRIVAQSIIIEGTVQTQDFVVRKELEFEVGNVLTPEAINESRRRLQRTGLFASVEIDTLEKNTTIARRTVVISVTERNPGLFNVGGGVNSEFDGTARVFSGLTYRNLHKKAHVASIRGELSKILRKTDNFYDKKIAFGYLYPYLFDTRLRGRFSASLKEDREGSSNKFDSTTATVLSLEYDITSSIHGVFETYRIENSETRSISADPGEGTSLVEGSREHLRSIGPRIEFDYRDNAFNPTKGSFTDFSLEYGDPAFAPGLGAPKFIKTRFSYTHYWNFTGHWVWANSARFGYLKNLGAEGKTVPYRRRGFFLGGPTTIRGFNGDESFPNDQLLDGSQSGYQLETDSTLYLFKSEVRFPIYENFGGAIFYDGGTIRVGDILFGRQGNLDWCPGHPSRTCDRPWRHSVGISLRYITPVGAASLELARKLDPQIRRTGTDSNGNPTFQDEDQFGVHIAIGTF